jgi:hypothetical protein
VECDGVRTFDSTTGDRGEKASTEEDGEDAEVLHRVHHTNVAVPGTKRILHTRTEIIWQHHDLENDIRRVKSEGDRRHTQC